jgi:ligand-binding sensor domain-containing protein
MALRARYNIVFFLIFFLISGSVTAFSLNESLGGYESGTQTPPYTIVLFIPSQNQVHSDQIKDQINDPKTGDVLIATAFGLSTYNGTWSTRHINRNNISEGLMDDFITAVEFDHQGNLWLGYSGGIQIYNGVYYTTIRNQQLLKETRIHDLQRWNDDMWVATGHAGIHRYRNGAWTWFQPMTKNGPGFYEINSMALDAASNYSKNNSLVIATANEGLWIVRAQDDPVEFEMLADKDSAAGQMQQVKQDPLGGVYFFNQEKIIHFDTLSGFNEVLSTSDLTEEQIAINDIAAGSDGNLYLATDDGLYIWREGGVYRHLNRFEGMGTSEIVRTVNVDKKKDAQDNVWFATQGYVGYYTDNTNPEKPIGWVLPTTLIPITIVTVTPINPNPSIPVAVNPSSDSFSLMTTFAQITDPITRAISAIAQKFGVNIVT